MGRWRGTWRSKFSPTAPAISTSSEWHPDSDGAVSLRNSCGLPWRPLAERGATPINLTVRVDNVGARALYASLGFTEERVILPLRKGFAVA